MMSHTQEIDMAKGRIAIVTVVVMVIVAALGLFYWHRVMQRNDVLRPLSWEDKRLLRTFQANFAENIWAFSTPDLSGKATNTTWAGKVLLQKSIGVGLFQTKVVRHKDRQVFSVMTGKKMKPGKEVWVRQFTYKTHLYSEDQQVFTVE